jgi:hypothetical protein
MGTPVVGVMVNQEQVVFIKAMSRSELSTAFLRELRRAVVATKKKKASVGPRSNAASALALER